MTKILEAVYESGVFKPLQSINLPDHQRVMLTVQVAPVMNAEDELAAWQEIFSDLSQQQVAEIESISLKRDNFMSARR